MKRRVDEHPLNAFVFNCKRQRTRDDQVPLAATNDAQAAAGSDTENEETSTVLNFYGTFEKADNISAHLLQRLTKEKARNVIARVHPRLVSIASRNRAANRLASQKCRFRIVNYVRSLSQTDDGFEGETVTTVMDDPLYSSYRELCDRSDDSGAEKSEDSNSESNWRNDYPDEDRDVFSGDNSVVPSDGFNEVDEENDDYLYLYD
ncbi:probable RNA polymerase II nuclear localization protein SLC7A6OS [Uranotaenia lowii]|uniref:probable RNA polymerase II nuclear localization protein SLC7A6OS n=1 Tax=Uranotaenia lowii TaxID=190385 RepID=UPI00247A9D49|nr:probable RNA polymerase II nuclear localization protein SLC7A6OS [Uranotaenia lowii]